MIRCIGQYPDDPFEWVRLACLKKCHTEGKIGLHNVTTMTGGPPTEAET